MIKKLFTICSLFLLLFALTGCNQKAEEKTSIKIGISVYDNHDTFIAELLNEFNERVSEKADETGITISVDVKSAAWSQSKQDSDVEDMVNNGCDILCVNLVDRTAPSFIIDIAEQNKIPVIFFNREPVDEDLERWEHLYYVGTDAAEAGRMQGEIAAEAFRMMQRADKNKDGIIQYVMLEGESGHQDAIVRTEVSVATLANEGFRVEKLSSATGNWDRAQALTKMELIVDEFGKDIELILANNDDMALGAADAYDAAGVIRTERPVIVGIDGTEVGKEAVRVGKMYGTVYNDREGQAKAMVNLAYAEAVLGDVSGIEFTKGRYIRVPHKKITN